MRKRSLRLIIAILGICMVLCVMSVTDSYAASKSITLDTAIKREATSLINSLTKSKDKAKRLKAVWNYMKSKKHLKYKAKYPDFSKNNWAKSYAYEMLRDKKGNCYGFASMFAACAATIGYNPTIICGRIKGTRDRRMGVSRDGYTRHAAVTINGKWYDVEAAWSGLMKNCYAKSKYPIKFINRKSYNYKKQSGAKKITTGATTTSASSIKVTKKGKNYIGKNGNGKALQGVYFINNKLYKFNKGVMKVSTFKKYQNLIKTGKSYKSLKAVIGKAKSSKVLGDSCYGNKQGKDKLYTYNGFEVTVFVYKSNGKEIIEDVGKNAETTSTSVSTTKNGTVFVKNGIANGWKKINKKWYYFKKKKAVTGLVKISKKYYYFNGKGQMQTGVQTIAGKTYYFKSKNGKAPAVTSATAKVKGTTYYFSPEGAGFKSVGNVKGNQAAAKVIDAVTFKSGMSQKEKLKVCYKYILKKVKYVGVLSPSLKSGWYYQTALDTIKSGKGKCYQYAALTGVVAKALGYSTKVVVGKSSYRFTSVSGDHAWVVVKSGGTSYVLDPVYDDTTPYGPYHGQLHFFMNRYAKLSGRYYQMKIKSSKKAVYAKKLSKAATITNYCYKEGKRY